MHSGEDVVESGVAWPSSVWVVAGVRITMVDHSVHSAHDRSFDVPDQLRKRLRVGCQLHGAQLVADDVPPSQVGWPGKLLACIDKMEES